MYLIETFKRIAQYAHVVMQLIDFMFAFVHLSVQYTVFLIITEERTEQVQSPYVHMSRIRVKKYSLKRSSNK